MSNPTDYEYTIITRNNSAECNLDPKLWESHPDWNVVIRTNRRHPDYSDRWITGGGMTFELAVAMAEFGIRQMCFVRSSMPEVVGIVFDLPIKLNGRESKAIIKNSDGIR